MGIRGLAHARMCYRDETRVPMWYLRVVLYQTVGHSTPDVQIHGLQQQQE